MPLAVTAGLLSGQAGGPSRPPLQHTEGTFAAELGSTAQSLWFADGTNYPGQDDIRARQEIYLPLFEGAMDVLDIGCGSGRALLIMAKTFPNSRFFGYDLCEEPILSARMEAAKMGLTNIQFHVKDLTHYRHEKRFDLITAFDAIHDQAEPSSAKLRTPPTAVKSISAINSSARER